MTGGSTSTVKPTVAVTTLPALSDADSASACTTWSPSSATTVPDVNAWPSSVNDDVTSTSSASTVTLTVTGWFTCARSATPPSTKRGGPAGCACTTTGPSSTSSSLSTKSFT